MNGQQGVVFIKRDGSSTTGQRWDQFMQAQQDALDSYRLHGWKLVTAIGVQEEKELKGVLLYFSKEG